VAALLHAGTRGTASDGQGRHGRASTEARGYREGEGMNRRKRELGEERATGLGVPPFALYTEEQGPMSWRAPRLTLPGKPPHRIASTVRARG